MTSPRRSENRSVSLIREDSNEPWAPAEPAAVVLKEISMNKKLNTALFFVGATVVNLVIVLALGLAVFIPYALLVGPHVPESFPI